MRRQQRDSAHGVCELRYFDDWADFLQCAKRILCQAQGDRYEGLACMSLQRGDRTWSGTDSLEEALELAEHGWEEGKLQFQALRDKLSIQSLLPQSQRFVQQFDVTGNEPDIDRYLQNEPEQMFTLLDTVQPQRGKVLRFLLNRTASAGTASASIVRRGVATLIAFEMLRILGYSVELTMVECVSAGGFGRWARQGRYEIYVPILCAGDPLNLDTLAFVFMHPSVLRRLVFAANECEPGSVRERFGFHASDGYGMPSEPADIPVNMELLSWDDGLLNSDDEIIPYALRLIGRFGIDLKQDSSST